MSRKLTLTIEKAILEQAKVYAKNTSRSLSELIENQLTILTQEKDEVKLEAILRAGVIDNKGVKVKGKMKLPFYNLTGDAYLATDYNEDVKFIYNEKSLCVFLKKTKNLVQMRKKTIIETHTFLFP